MNIKGIAQIIILMLSLSAVVKLWVNLIKEGM